MRVDAGGRRGEVADGNVDMDVDMNNEDAKIWDLRVYCWGEVVQHIYYLLFVASRSKVKMAVSYTHLTLPTKRIV